MKISVINKVYCELFTLYIETKDGMFIKSNTTFNSICHRWEFHPNVAFYDSMKIKDLLRWYWARKVKE